MACRTARQKRELVRVVRTPDGRVLMDETGRLAGRGAYLCADGGCWRIGLEKGTLQRALGVPLPEDLKARLRAGAGVVAGAAGRAVQPARVRSEPGSATIDELSEGEPSGEE